MTELSPAAQAVSDAFWNPGIHVGLNYRLVMAIRAIAENCVPDDSEGHWVYTPHVRNIANEIENNYSRPGKLTENPWNSMHTKAASINQEEGA